MGAVVTDEQATFRKHQHSLKEHLAGVKGAHAWIQELSAQHLLRSQSPIRDEPVPEHQEQAR